MKKLKVREKTKKRLEKEQKAAPSRISGTSVHRATKRNAAMFSAFLDSTGRPHAIRCNTK